MGEMNAIVERDIAHVGRIVRASVFSCAPRVALVGYWCRRVNSLIADDGLTDIQLHTLRGLLRELDGIEGELIDRRGERLRSARPPQPQLEELQLAAG
jgi:hypothetical protein